MCRELFSEESTYGSSLVMDHEIYAFGVVAYGRFDCNFQQNLLVFQSFFIPKQTATENLQKG